jgi:cell division initiation protein
MRITPLDVRKQEFKRGMRGYDNDEVRAFLGNVADEYEAVLVDNKQLRERILEQDEKLTEFRNLEKALRDTLMTAEKLMQESKETARRQGEVVISEARQRAQETLAEGRARLEELRREALAVHREKDTFLARFRSLAEAQIQFCEAHRHDFRDLDGRLLERPGASSQPADAAGQHAPGTAPTPTDGSSGDYWRDYKAGPEAVRQATPADAQSIAEAVQTIENRPIVAQQPYAAVDLDQVS